MLVAHLIGLAAGFVLSGFLVARRMRADLRWGAAFVVSCLLLFHAVFWTGVLGIPIRLASIATALALLTAIAWVLAAKVPLREGMGDLHSGEGDPHLPPAGWWERVVASGAAAVGAAVLLRATLAPLAEWDNPIRWDHLARVIAELGTFSFYPPLAPADFEHYFLVDAIPPLVPFSTWWVYATAGRVLPALTGSLVAAQFAATLAFTAAAASAQFGPRAGWWAAGVLASSPIFVNSVAMGQETGMTALSVAATVAFLCRDSEARGPAPLVLGALATALGILSREYGWSFLLVGALVLLWRGAAARRVLVYLAVAAAVALPWYARNLVLTGNPLYGAPLGPLAVNPVFAAMVDFYRERLGVSTWAAADWVAILRYLLERATLPLLVGGAAAAIFARRHGYLALSALLVTALWLLSVGYTSGGPEYAARMLAPALVLLSIGAGGLLARPASRRVARAAAALVVVAACSWSLRSALLHPYEPAGVAADRWLSLTLARYESVHGQAWEGIQEFLPRGARVLGDDAYLFAWLRPRGVQLVPVWSPEVGFIDDPALPLAKIRSRLAERGIRHVWLPGGMNGNFLARSLRFYRDDAGSWLPVFETGGGSLLAIPASAGGERR